MKEKVRVTVNIVRVRVKIRVSVGFLSVAALMRGAVLWWCGVVVVVRCIDQGQ